MRALVTVDRSEIPDYSTVRIGVLLLWNCPKCQNRNSSSRVPTRQRCADALRSIMAEGKRFGFGAMTIVRGAPRTGRILLMNQRWDAVTLRSRLSPYGAVTEMTRLVRSEEARYDPPENPGMIQGWEVRKAMVDGESYRDHLDILGSPLGLSFSAPATARFFCFAKQINPVPAKIPFAGALNLKE